MASTSFKVDGMKCGGCEKSVKAAADAVAGVLSSQASAKDGTVIVEFDDTKTSAAAIQQAVQAAGYPLV